MAHERLIALSSSLVSLAGVGCANSKNTLNLDNNPNVLHVFESDWIGVEDDSVANACITSKGGELAISGQDVLYYQGPNDDGGETSCVNGTYTGYTPAYARKQEKLYEQNLNRKKSVIKQIANLINKQGKVYSPDTSDWVTIVNPKPINQKYVNGDEQLNFGDSCIASAPSFKLLGKLSTGEQVREVINPNQNGTACPNGAIYLYPEDQNYSN